MARLEEYFQDPWAPGAKGIAAVAFAVVRDRRGQVLLVQRADDGLWELPGGRMEVGESASSAVVREVAEEAGVDIEVTGVSGVYSDPTHVLVYAEGAVQQLALCFHAVPRDEQAVAGVGPDGVETVAVEWFALDQAASLPMHPAVRRRLRDATVAAGRTHFD